jgi:hypothetical protein
VTEHCRFCDSCRAEFSLPEARFCSHCGAVRNLKATPAPEAELTEYEKLLNKNIERNNEKLRSLNPLSMPANAPTSKSPKQKTPKGLI